MKKAVRMAVAAGMCAALALSAGCQKKTVADDEVQRYAWPLATASPEDTVTQIYAEQFEDPGLSERYDRRGQRASGEL